MRLGVPAYFHPEREAGDWARVRAAGVCVGIVVINPASGPGTGDPAYGAAVRGLPGLVAGYVDTTYATRPLAEVLADAAAHRRLHGVTAVFADQVTSGTADLRYYAALADALPGPLVLNPGVRPHPAYLALADVVVTFEGPWSAHRELSGPEPVGRARTWHLVHDVPAIEQDRVVQRAADLGAAHACAQDRTIPNPWGALPTRWPGAVGEGR